MMQTDAVSKMLCFEANKNDENLQNNAIVRLHSLYFFGWKIKNIMNG
jgi:hypothetical protein